MKTMIRRISLLASERSRRRDVGAPMRKSG
jgi:hypothetical protein